MNKVVARATRISNWAVRTYKRTSDYTVKKWPVFRRFAVVELTPPTPLDIGRAVVQGKNIVQKGMAGGWRDLTIYETMMGFIVCWESFMWFFLGECIGRRCLRGYEIDGAVYKVFAPVYFANNNVGFDVWELKLD